MGIGINSNFDLGTTLPLDSRTKVADLAARDAIPSGVRYEGLLVYVVAEAKNFQLVGGIANGNWQELSGGSGSGVVVVADAAARLAIISGDRTEGMIVYQQDSRTHYTLRGGILDANWALFTGWQIDATQTLSNGDKIQLKNRARQLIYIQSIGGQVNLNPIVFDIPNGIEDGAEICLVALSDTNIVKLTANDTAGGQVGRIPEDGEFSSLYSTWFFIVDKTLDRFVFRRG